MPTKPKARPTTRRTPPRKIDARKVELAALRKAHRVEKDIQRMARALDREMQRTNDRLQALAMALTFRAKALEMERDVDRSLAGVQG